MNKVVVRKEKTEGGLEGMYIHTSAKGRKEGGTNDWLTKKTKRRKLKIEIIKKQIRKEKGKTVVCHRLDFF